MTGSERTSILIVEDERLIAENNAILLRNLGYEVTDIVSTGQDALASIEKRTPDIVLLDIMLAGEMDGIELADQLRARFNLPFVYATAFADDNTLERAKITAPYGYVLKPFSERDLHSNLEMALYKHRSEQKIDYLNQVLYALNQINQLIVHEHSWKKLLQGTCDTLVQSESFLYAWAGRLAEENELVFTAQAHSVLEEAEFEPLTFSGQLAECATRALTEPNPVIMLNGCDSCENCQITDHFPNEAILTSKLEAEGQLYGLVVVVLHKELARNREIVELFQEVAQGIGFALHSREMEALAEATQADLVKSEEKYRLLAETAPDMIMVYDLEGYISYTNQAGESLSGYSLDELQEKRVMDITPERFHSRLLEISDRSHAGKGAARTFELGLLPKQGDPIPLEVICTVLRDRDRPQAFLLIGRDIRERMAAEIELRKLSRAVEQSPVAVLITDHQGLISYVNPKFTEITGFTAAEVLNKYPAILQDDDSEETGHASLLAKLQDAEEWHGIVPSHKSNGEKFWVSANVTSLRNRSGEITHHVAVLEDITEQRQIEEQIRSARASYEDIFNSTGDAIGVLREDGTFLTVNQGTLEMFGYAPETLYNKTFEFLAADDRMDMEAMEARMVEAFAGLPQRFEFWAKDAQGTLIPCDVQLNRVQYFGQQVLLASARNISHRKRVETELKSALRRAQESEKVKGNFLANMSHEIRTPLTSIIGYIDLIYTSLQDAIGEEQQSYFNIVRRNSDRLTRTVHGILDLSQIEAGSLDLYPRDLDLIQITENLVNDFLPRAHSKGLELTFQKEVSAGLIHADEHTLTSALTNILENAIIYTEKGGVTVRLGKDDENLTLAISDTGIGISPEYLTRIYDAFSQESSGYTKNYQGLGLGLTIAKRCLEMNAIELGVESRKNDGSTFTLQFKPSLNPPPPTEASTEPVPIPEKQPVPILDKGRTGFDKDQIQVLIVEDDPSAQKLFGLFLRDHYSVHYATTVKEGRAILKKAHINLVITDLSLVGGEDGLVLVEYIRKQKKTKHLPVIALTAHAFVSDRDRCLEAGCDDFLTKPIFKQKLLETIQQYVNPQSGS